MNKKLSATTVNFSVSSNNADILDILKDQQNKSEFICQAIREKYSSDRGDFSDKMTNGQKEFLRNEIKSVLIEMMGNNICVYGSVPPQGVMMPVTMPVQSNPVQNTAPKKNVPDFEDNEENSDLLSNIFNNL